MRRFVSLRPSWNILEEADFIRRVAEVDGLSDALTRLLADMGPGDCRPFDSVHGPTRTKGFALGYLEHVLDPRWYDTNERAEGDWFTTTAKGYRVGVLIRHLQVKKPRGRKQ